MFEDANAKVFITQKSLCSRFADVNCTTILIDEQWPDIEKCSPENCCKIVDLQSIAYMIYTSGSTGKPNGVCGTHLGTINRLAWSWQAFSFKPQEACYQKTSLGDHLRC
jgi:non-ribosomal peptide synthetase component F